MQVHFIANLAFMKFLVIRLSSIGDVVLTSLAVRCLRKAYPDAGIDYLTKQQYAQIPESNPDVDRVLILGENLWNTSREISGNDYDYVIDFHANLRSRLLIQLLPERMKVLRYDKRALRRTLSVWLRKDLYGGHHIAEQFLAALAPLNVANDGGGLSYYIQPQDEVSKSTLPFTHKAGFGVLAIGATHFTKKLPDDQWEDICRQLRIPLIVIGGPDETVLGERLRQLDDLKILNKCGVYTLGQSASVIRQSAFVITHDTGMMHIAAALKKRTVSVWGGTVPWLGFSPYALPAPLQQIIEMETLACRPCSKYGRSSCPEEHFNCMKGIDTERIIAATGIRDTESKLLTLE